MPQSLAWDAAGVMARLDALAACTERAGEITRLFLTPAHAQAVALVRGWMEDAGLHTALDPSGTLVGTRPVPNAPSLMIGSHIDTVRRAGRYDGCLGVLLGVALAARLRDANLRYGLDIRAFGDEEGVRFPVTLTGAHAAAGHFDPAWLGAADSDGITLSQALTEFGLDPQALAAGACTAESVFAYLEIHIEQGPVLEAAGAPLGVVTAINGAKRFSVTVTGRAGHAGTVPMAARQDALVTAAEMILSVRGVALAHPGVVGTVGRISVFPGATNVIPGACDFTLDLRAPDDALRDTAEREILDVFRTVAASNGVAWESACLHEAPATSCDPRLRAHLAQALTEKGFSPLHLASGAGHDAMAVAALCPVGMLFVRCAGGISHHPDESVTEADVAAALDVMTHALQTLNPADFSTP